MHIFISYSKRDIDFARYLKRALEESGFIVWMDETAMRPSTRWWPTIERNIETSSAVVVIMSPNSRDSDWVEREVLYAERLRKPIFPVLLAGEDWPRLANIQYSDMTAGLDAELPYALLDGLSAVILPGRSSGVVAPPEELPGPRLPDSARPARSGRGVWLTGALVIALLIVAGVVFAQTTRGNSSKNDHATATAAALAQLAASQTATTPAPDVPTATPTFPVINSPIPTHTPALDTGTPTAPVINTPVPSDTPEPDTNTPVPQVTELPARAAALALHLDPDATPYPELADNRLWAPQKHRLHDLPVVYVPGGCFLMGLDQGEPDEKPAHQACLSPFWLTATEITNVQYQACVTAGACTPPTSREFYSDSAYDQHPVVFVTWQQARDYATWIGGALPTEAQWEYAARGPSGWNYPWSNLVPGCTYAVLDNCADGMAPVGVGERPLGASWVGAEDLAGSVWEWIADWYNANTYTTSSAGLDPIGPAGGVVHVIRGGGWDSPIEVARGSFRNFRSKPDYSGNEVGFRVAFPLTARE